MASPISSSGVNRLKVLNSLILISVVLLIIQFLPQILFYIIVIIIIGRGLDEFYSLLVKMGIPCFRRFGILMGIVLSLAFTIDHSSLVSIVHIDIIEVTLLLVFILTIIRSLFSRNLSIVMPALTGTLFGVFYVSFLASYLIPLRKLPSGENFVSLAFIVTWARDAGAYGIGSMLKRGHVLFRSINPNKTVEGSIAGLSFSLVFSLLTKIIFFSGESYWHFIVIGLLIGILGQAGDLVESMFKRCAGVKDTGTVLPFHGGILDRIDGLLFTAPLLYYYVHLFIVTAL